VLFGDPSASGSGSACHRQKPAFLCTPGGEPARRTPSACMRWSCGTEESSGEGGAFADLVRVGWLAVATLGARTLPVGEGTLRAVAVVMRLSVCAAALPAEATFSEP
jgi:hypothetical protein